MPETWAHAHRPRWLDWGGTLRGGHLRVGPVLVDRGPCHPAGQPRIDGAMTVLEERDPGAAQARRRATFGGVAVHLGSSLFVLTLRGRPMFPSYALRRRWRRIRHPIASRRPAVLEGVEGGGEKLVSTGPRALP